MILARWLDGLRRPPSPTGAHAALTVALISDELTRACLRRECRVLDLTPANAARLLRRERPDLLFVESAWHGVRESWKYGIAAYPEHPERSNRELARVVGLARELGIPALFWNKEDGIHFERFIASAMLFDHVFTVDANCVPRYRARMPHAKSIETLLFAVQPAVHGCTGSAPRTTRADFVGSYSRHIHETRRALQDQLFAVAGRTLGLTVYDRNSSRRSAHYRYPALPGLEVRPAVPHEQTARIYREHLVSLNVNTVQDSPTMFSRRLVEILGCGALAVTTPALAVERLFAGCCHVVHDEAGMEELFGRLQRDGLSARDREMMRAGAELVAREHTWSHRLQELREALGIEA